MPIDLSGGRHYHMPPQPTIWTCPACGAEQTGPIPEGCTSCGSGQPGSKAEESPEPTFLVQAYRTWIGQTTANDAYAAFRGGYEFAMRLIAENPPLIDHAPSSTSSTQSTSAGAAAEIVLTPVVCRTLAAALAAFIEQVLVGGPEEIVSGEWLDAAAAGELMKQLQEKGKAA